MSELGYVPNVFAQRMRGTTSHIVGLVLRDITSPLLGALFRSAQEVLQADGDVVFVACHDEDKERELEVLTLLSRQHVDGIIMTTSSEDDVDLVRARADLSVPLVLCDREAPVGCDSVRAAHKEGTRRAMDYLLDLGHRRIALTTGPTTVYPSRARLEAYEEALRGRGIEPDPRMVRLRSFGALSSFADISALLDLPNAPTALLLGGIDMLPEALRAIRDRGLRIPRDISVIGAGDSTIARLGVPPITVVSWDFAELGRACANLLRDRLRVTDNPPPTKMLFPAELVIRESCAPPSQDD